MTTLPPDKRALPAKRLRAAVEQVGAAEQGAAGAQARRSRRTIQARFALVAPRPLPSRLPHTKRR